MKKKVGDISALGGDPHIDEGNAGAHSFQKVPVYNLPRCTRQAICQTYTSQKQKGYQQERSLLEENSPIGTLKHQKG